MGFVSFAASIVSFSFSPFRAFAFRSCMVFKHCVSHCVCVCAVQNSNTLLWNKAFNSQLKHTLNCEWFSFTSTPPDHHHWIAFVASTHHSRKTYYTYTAFNINTSLRFHIFLWPHFYSPSLHSLHSFAAFCTFFTALVQRPFFYLFLSHTLIIHSAVVAYFTFHIRSLIETEWCIKWICRKIWLKTVHRTTTHRTSCTPYETLEKCVCASNGFGMVCVCTQCMCI